MHENLEIGAYVPKAKAERARTLDLVYSIFPRLAERRKQLAGTMSGGEQQMLAVGRGLMLKPRLLMLDEPSLGLAPVMTDVTFEKIGEIHKMGTAILLVEQNVSRALSLVQRAYVLESGKVIMHGTQRRAGQQQAGAGGVSRDLMQLPTGLMVRDARQAVLLTEGHANHLILRRTAGRAPHDDGQVYHLILRSREAASRRIEARINSPPSASARRSRTSAEIHPSASSTRASRIGLPLTSILPAPTASGNVVSFAMTSSSTPRASVKLASASASARRRYRSAHNSRD